MKGKRYCEKNCLLLLTLMQTKSRKKIVWESAVTTLLQNNREGKREERRKGAQDLVDLSEFIYTSHNHLEMGDVMGTSSTKEG